MSLRSAGAFVTIVDDGFSFQNSCILQGGAFIRFSLDLDVCINPFGLVDHAYEGDDRQEVMAEARNNVTLMVLQAARGENDITPEERGVVEQAVGEVWEELGSDGSIEAVAKVLEARHGERGVNLAISLSAFRVGGVYGRFFNGRANLDISNPLTVFEMSDLETKKDLRSVVIMAILALVRKRMKSGGRALKKALIIDEAWQLLGGGMTGAFIEGFARRCRKEGGALITGTQSLNDYYKTSGAQACIENSDWSVVLRLKEEALEQLRTNDRLSVDENQLQMLKSLRTSDGEFSELMVKGPHGSFCARLVLDPFSATLFSTKPDVFAAVDTLKRRGVSMDEAIRRVAAGARGEPEVVDGAELMRLERLLRADPDLRELAGAWGRMGLGGRRRLFTAAREVGPEMEEAA